MATERMAIVRLPGCFPISLRLSWAHWRRAGTRHGARSNPAFVAVSFVQLGIRPPSSGRRLWVYVRGGYALFVEVSVDRRQFVGAS
jgi:hypothetical protein